MRSQYLLQLGYMTLKTVHEVLVARDQHYGNEMENRSFTLIGIQPFFTNTYLNRKLGFKNV